jgi:bifunctional non-homologous end joining protein LigD
MGIRKAGQSVSVWSRNGRPWTTELSAIAEAVRALHADDLVIDGEAVAHCHQGLPDFHRLLGDGKVTACLCTFDVLFLRGEDLRPLPLEDRKEQLASVLRGAPEVVRYSEHMDGPDGPAVYAHACRLGLEGIVSKRRNRACDRRTTSGGSARRRTPVTCSNLSRPSSSPCGRSRRG